MVVAAVEDVDGADGETGERLDFGLGEAAGDRDGADVEAAGDVVQLISLM